MENATKALTMAASILIGILIITLMFILFRSGAKAGNRGDKETERIAIEQFNVNFTKYLGKDLTVYDVVSISNYKDSCGRTVTISGGLTVENIKDNISNTYKLEINGYDEHGFVSGIKISKQP